MDKVTKWERDNVTWPLLAAYVFRYRDMNIATYCPVNCDHYYHRKISPNKGESKSFLSYRSHISRQTKFYFRLFIRFQWHLPNGEWSIDFWRGATVHSNIGCLSKWFLLAFAALNKGSFELMVADCAIYA